MRSFVLTVLACILGLALAVPSPAAAEEPLFAQENLAAWCIVPFDAKQRGPEARAAMGVSEGLLRISVGLEDVQDLIEDLDQALHSIGM